MKLKNGRKNAGTESNTAPKILSGSNGNRYLDLLLDETKEILAYIDIDLRYLHVNKAYANCLGLQKNDFEGKYISDFFDEQTFHKLLPKFIKAFSGEHVRFKYHDVIDNADIEIIPHFENTDIIGCIWLIRQPKVMHKKTAKANLHSRKDDAFWSLDSDLMAIVSLNGDLLYLNTGWEKTLGYDFSELKDNNLINVVESEDKERAQLKFDELKTGKRVIDLTIRMHCKDESFRWFEWHFLRKGNLIYAIANDITYYISSLEDKESSINKLNELNSSKDQFLAIIAHDLKSPFSNILGFTDLLKSNIEAYDKELITQILEQLYNASKIAYELLENLLDWSRVQTDRIEFEPERFGFHEFISNYLPTLKAIASTKQITINVFIPADLIIFADPNLTKTVLRNLVSNAVKFSNRNDTIVINAEQTDGLVKVSVIDYGVGIPAKEIHKLFRIDTKYSTPGTMNEKGTGLGLILCKDFVEKQGGKIWVESTEGQGSVFFFTLPC